MEAADVLLHILALCGWKRQQENAAFLEFRDAHGQGCLLQTYCFCHQIENFLSLENTVSSITQCPPHDTRDNLYGLVKAIPSSKNTKARKTNCSRRVKNSVSCICFNSNADHNSSHFIKSCTVSHAAGWEDHLPYLFKKFLQLSTSTF